jgi:hypothetical protein
VFCGGGGRLNKDGEKTEAKRMKKMSWRTVWLPERSMRC